MSKLFKDLSTDEKLNLIEAFLAGKAVEYFNSYIGQWTPKRSYEKGRSCIFHDNTSYRICKHKHEVDWSKIDKKYNYMAVDRDSDVWFYSDKPIFLNSTWKIKKGSLANLTSPKFLDPKVINSIVKLNPDVHWTDSLVCRNEE